MPAPEIAHRMRVVRHIAQLSRPDLAGCLQTSSSQPIRMERGLADDIGVERLRRLGEAAGVSPCWLYGTCSEIYCKRCYRLEKAHVAPILTR